jgi:predicted nucleotidyltransferase
MSERVRQPGPANTVFEHPRFIEGSSENAQTLEHFAQGLQELQAVNPEIVGATLFGSRLKGEATAKSDVDCAILVDADKLASEGVDLSVDETGTIQWGEYEELKEGFKSHFADVLSGATHKDPSTIREGLYIEPISNELIETQLSTHIDYLKNRDKYQADYSNWTQNSMLDSPQPQEPDYVRIDGNISALFGPELAPGHDKYRQAVINKLSQTGEYGEAVWQEILYGIQFGEGHYDMEDSSKYPATLQQAQEWYGEHDGQ